MEIPPDEPPGASIPENIWRWILYLKRRISDLQRKAQINKIESSQIAAVASVARKELDIARLEAGKQSGVVTKLHRRLDRLQELRSNGSDKPPALDSGSDDSWGPGPDADRSCGRSEVSQSDHAPSTCCSARQSDPMPPRRSGEEERDEWLSADLHRRCDPLQTPVQPKRPGHALERAQPAHGRCGPLRDEVPEEDTEWDLKRPDGDPWRTPGSTHHGDQEAGGAVTRRSTWNRYAEESLEELTWRSRAQLLGHPRGDERGSRGNPRWTPVKTSFDLPTGVHGL